MKKSASILQGGSADFKNKTQGVITDVFRINANIPSRFNIYSLQVGVRKKFLYRSK